MIAKANNEIVKHYVTNERPGCEPGRSLCLLAAVALVKPFTNEMRDKSGYDRNDEIVKHVYVTLLPVPELPSEGAAILTITLKP